jgi:hypothetical protein
MSKKLIASVIVISIVLMAAGIIFLKVTADKAREQSDQILKDFKTINKDLKLSNKTIDSLTEVKDGSANNN